MGRVVVISTGGTIASRWQGSGFAAEARGREVLAAADLPDGIETEVVDLFSVNSSRLTTAHQLTLLRTTHQVLADPEVDGIVITHGTDTLEESAFLLDLHHNDPRPVVFTGAQRPPDTADSDASGNLRDAVLTAASARGLGVLVVFDGRVHAARGTIKTQTLAVNAFADPSGAHLGEVGFGEVIIRRQPRRPHPLPLPHPAEPLPRIDMVMHHCDGDPVLLRAAVGAGAQGVVLVATGAGNATPQVVEAISEALETGVLVAVTTRVPAGPVAEVYTGGGAVDLAAAGAVLTGTLRAGQARIAVLSAVLAGDHPAARAETLRQIIDHASPADAATALACA